jgi:hypothetical protein
LKIAEGKENLDLVQEETETKSIESNKKIDWVDADSNKENKYKGKFLNPILWKIYINVFYL